MQTPAVESLGSFQARRRAYLANHVYKSKEDEKWYCSVCGGRLKVVAAVIEIHAPGSTCQSDSGEEFTTGIPYCQDCEEIPAARGCVHG